jgi:hypothetical protein
MTEIFRFWNTGTGEFNINQDVKNSLGIRVSLGWLSQRLNTNRFSAGSGLKITKNLKGEIYYILQDIINSGKWIAVNVLGTKFFF